MDERRRLLDGSDLRLQLFPPRRIRVQLVFNH
jgi:hypothetical protein